MMKFMKILKVNIYAKFILILIVILIFNRIAVSECIAPFSGMHIKNNTVFCNDTYILNESIFLEENASLDCNGAVLIGPGTFYNGEWNGIAIINITNVNNLVVKNCKITNVPFGIRAINLSNENGKVLIQNNEFYNVQGAIGFTKTKLRELIIYSNSINSELAGIFLYSEEISNVDIRQNKLITENCNYYNAIQTTNKARINNNYMHNLCKENISEHSTGIVVGNDGVVDNNTIQNFYIGIWLDGENNNIYKNNIINYKKAIFLNEKYKKSNLIKNNKLIKKIGINNLFVVVILVILFLFSLYFLLIRKNKSVNHKHFNM
ncbi:MAG: hypothetical protein ACP5H9_02650 [Candidatus Woesearchaeota archaeon]